jgi:hypothetical protein
MDIPIELFITFIISTFTMIVIGFVGKRRIPFLTIIAGAFIVFLSISIDNIILGFSQTSETTTSNSNLVPELRAQQLTGGSNGAMFSGSVGTYGQFIQSNSSMTGLSINTIELDLKRTGCGACGGSLIVGIKGTPPTAFTKVFESRTLSSMGLTTSYQSYNFTMQSFSNSYIIASGDRIAVDIFSSTGTGVGNTIDVSYSPSESVGGTASRLQSSTGVAWVNVGSADLKFRLFGTGTTTETTTVTESTPNSVQFTEWPKILFGLMGSIIMLVGVISWKEEEKPLL